MQNYVRPEFSMYSSIMWTRRVYITSIISQVHLLMEIHVSVNFFLQQLSIFQLILMELPSLTSLNWISFFLVTFSITHTHTEKHI